MNHKGQNKTIPVRLSQSDLNPQVNKPGPSLSSSGAETLHILLHWIKSWPPNKVNVNEVVKGLYKIIKCFVSTGSKNSLKHLFVIFPFSFFHSSSLFIVDCNCFVPAVFLRLDGAEGGRGRERRWPSEADATWGECSAGGQRKRQRPFPADHS